MTAPSRGTCWPCSGRRRICDLRPFEPVSGVAFVGTIFVSLPEESNYEVGPQPHDGRNDQDCQQLAHGCAPSNRSNNVSLICAFRYWPKRTFHYVAFDVAFRGKADMPFCTAHVCPRVRNEFFARNFHAKDECARQREQTGR